MCIGFEVLSLRFDSFCFNKDICGMICAAFTWMLIGYAFFVVIFVMLLPEIDTAYNAINAGAFLLFALLATVSHMKAMITDPVRNRP